MSFFTSAIDTFLKFSYYTYTLIFSRVGNFRNIKKQGDYLCPQHLCLPTNFAFCSSCGVCEMYACPQSLAPRTLLADMKGGLRKAGIRPPQGVQPKPVQESREYRKVPEERLMARLGLTKYDKDAPLQEELVNVSKVKVLLSQHIGAPAQAIVNVGDMVTEGQMIAQPAQGLSVGIHATISGKVTEVTDRHVVIARN